MEDKNRPQKELKPRYVDIFKNKTENSSVYKYLRIG